MLRISELKRNMQDFKMISRKKGIKKKKKENKKLNQLWLHLLIQSLRIKKNKLDFKMKKC